MNLRKQQGLIEKLGLKGKKRIEIRKTIRIPVHYDVTKNKMDMLVRLTERITYSIRLIGELVSDVYTDTFINGDDNDLNSILTVGKSNDENNPYNIELVR